MPCKSGSEATRTRAARSSVATRSASSSEPSRLADFRIRERRVSISASSLSGALTSRAGLGVAVGLVLGKVIGVTAFTAWAVHSGAAELPPRVSWRQVIGVGFLAGIGFTVSLFITDLAFEDAAVIT